MQPGDELTFKGTDGVEVPVTFHRRANALDKANWFATMGTPGIELVVVKLEQPMLGKQYLIVDIGRECH